MKLRMLFCKHYWEFLEKNRIVNEVLCQCVKCGVYMVWHRGIGVEYKTSKWPTNKGWEGGYRFAMEMAKDKGETNDYRE